MDRAAFLTSLPYLRHLPPALWDKCLAEPTSSCSTATPPTPRSESDSLLLDDVVVSIEPIHRSSTNRKRDRNDDYGRPAFFLCKQVMAEPSGDVNTAKTANNEEHGSICKEKINNDPAICSFEIAVVKRKQILSCLGCEKDVLTTPNKTDMDVDDCQSQSQSEIQSPMVPHMSLDSNVLLFRFGHYFVFEANASAITSIDHQAEEEGKDDDEKEHEGVESTEVRDMQQLKRQRIEDGKAEKADGVKRPSCLCISFPSCTFRLFTVEKNLESNGDRQSDASRILETKSKIMRHFDIDNNLTWAPIPSETIHADDWLCCLDQKEKEKASPVKTDSNSTHFEKGQKHTPEIRAVDNEDEEGAKSNVLNSETQPIDSIDRIFNEKYSKQSSSQNHEDGAMTGSIHPKQGECAVEKDGTFWHQVSAKRRAFDGSWLKLQESCDTPKSSFSLTSCAHSLARSYCNSKQLSSIFMHCDSDIDATTNKIQGLIETLMPARGRGTDNKALTHSNTSIDTEQSINDLLRSRKEAVSAKYASFLIPKK